MPAIARFVRHRGAARRVRSSVTWTFVAFVLLAASCVPPEKPPDTYVALGDSFSAGTFIANQIPPQGCFKSDRSYPHLLAPSTKLPKLVDVSCSGAKTDHMTQSQTLPFGAPNPPQFDVLDSMTGIVTLTIGGNDVGYWSTIADACRSTTVGRDTVPGPVRGERSGQDQPAHRRSSPEGRRGARRHPPARAAGQGLHPGV